MLSPSNSWSHFGRPAATSRGTASRWVSWGRSHAATYSKDDAQPRLVRRTMELILLCIRSADAKEVEILVLGGLMHEYDLVA